MITDVIPIKRGMVQFWEQYVQDLKYAIGYYTSWVPRRYSDIVSEDEGFEILKNDEKIRETLNLLSLFSAGEKHEITCFSPVLTDLAQKALSNIERYQHAKKSAIFNSTLFGLSLQKVTWERKRIRGYPGTWEMPRKVQEIDKRVLRLERDTEKRKSYWTIWMEEYDAYIVMANRCLYPNYQGPKIQDYLWMWYEQEQTEPYYRGLSQILFRFAYTKNLILQYWHDLAETWSKPWLHMETDGQKGGHGVSLSQGYDSWAGRVEEIVSELIKHKARHVFVTDKDSDTLNIHEQGSIGTNILLQYLMYADERIQKNILGEELQDKGGGGSFNLATLKREAMDALVIDSRSALQETHTDQLLGEFWYRNRQNLMMMGLPIPDRGEVQLQFMIESEEIKKDYLSEGLSEDRKQRSRANI